MTGVLASVLAGYHARAWEASASDFKTLYAAADCFRRHADPFNFPNIAAVFQTNQVVPPVSWYGHAPVYPPFTLAVIAPLTLIPMVQAIYVWMAISALAFVVAVFLLTCAASQLFQLSVAWRLALIALFAASPLLSFSLEMGNVSAVVAALSIAAVVFKQIRPRLLFVPPVALAVALLLKPHLALWVVAALFISRDARSRRLALASVGVFLAALLAIALWMAVHHQLDPEIASYRAMVHQEAAGGSMDPTKHEAVAVPAQITSLASLLGYWLSGASLMIATAALLLLGLATLTYASLTQETGNIFVQVGAWSAFGLLATYHRAHDGVVLLLLLPWILFRLRRSWKDPVGLLLLSFSFLIGLGPSWDAYTKLAAWRGMTRIAHFLLFRQSAFVTALLLLLLLTISVIDSRSRSLAAID